jgi:hypothetical protein
MTDIIDQTDGASNILLKAPPISEGQQISTSLLVDAVTQPNVLFVTYTKSAEACVQQVEDAQVGQIGVITVADSSAGADGATTETVSTPSDLTGLGIKIGQFLSEWDTPIHVSFDSLTSMLQYVDFGTAYEFLHAITGQIYAAGARAHFHIDPSAHDEQDVAGIESLFDATISLDDEVTVRTRELL